MSSFVPRTLLATTATAALGLVGFSGCADNHSTLFVVGVLARSDDCSGYIFDPGQPRLGSGLMDKLMVDGYSAGLLLGNQLVAQGNNDQVRTETSRIALQGAEVRLTQAETGAQLAHYTTTISGTVDPSPSTNPGYFGAVVMMIPAGLDLDPGEYLSSVRVFGETLGGQDVESGEFVFPIVVCDGCSVVVGGEVTASGDCLPPQGATLDVCAAGLDGPTDCSVCQAMVPQSDRDRCLPQ